MSEPSLAGDALFLFTNPLAESKTIDNVTQVYYYDLLNVNDEKSEILKSLDISSPRVQTTYRMVTGARAQDFYNAIVPDTDELGLFQPKLVHLSAHGEHCLNFNKENDTAVLFECSDNGSGQNPSTVTRITTYDIQWHFFKTFNGSISNNITKQEDWYKAQWKSNTKLAVLSCCESNYLAEWLVNSMNISCVIATTDSISDSIATKVLANFYHFLYSGKTILNSLKLAQRTHTTIFKLYGSQEGQNMILFPAITASHLSHSSQSSTPIYSSPSRRSFNSEQQQNQSLISHSISSSAATATATTTTTTVVAAAAAVPPSTHGYIKRLPPYDMTPFVHQLPLQTLVSASKLLSEYLISTFCRTGERFFCFRNPNSAKHRDGWGKHTAAELVLYYISQRPKMGIASIQTVRIPPPDLNAVDYKTNLQPSREKIIKLVQDSIDKGMEEVKSINKSDRSDDFASQYDINRSKMVLYIPWMDHTAVDQNNPTGASLNSLPFKQHQIVLEYLNQLSSDISQNLIVFIVMGIPISYHMNSISSIIPIPPSLKDRTEFFMNHSWMRLQKRLDDVVEINHNYSNKTNNSIPKDEPLPPSIDIIKKRLEYLPLFQPLGIKKNQNNVNNNNQINRNLRLSIEEPIEEEDHIHNFNILKLINTNYASDNTFREMRLKLEKTSPTMQSPNFDGALLSPAFSIMSGGGGGGGGGPLSTMSMHSYCTDPRSYCHSHIPNNLSHHGHRIPGGSHSRNPSTGHNPLNIGMVHNTHTVDGGVDIPYIDMSHMPHYLDLPHNNSNNSNLHPNFLHQTHLNYNNPSNNSHGLHLNHPKPTPLIDYPDYNPTDIKNHNTIRPNPFSSSQTPRFDPKNTGFDYSKLPPRNNNNVIINNDNNINPVIKSFSPLIGGRRSSMPSAILNLHALPPNNDNQPQSQQKPIDPHPQNTQNKAPSTTSTVSSLHSISSTKPGWLGKISAHNRLSVPITMTTANKSTPSTITSNIIVPDTPKSSELTPTNLINKNSTLLTTTPETQNISLPVQATIPNFTTPTFHTPTPIAQYEMGSDNHGVVGNQTGLQLLQTMKNNPKIAQSTQDLPQSGSKPHQVISKSQPNSPPNHQQHLQQHQQPETFQPGWGAQEQLNDQLNEQSQLHNPFQPGSPDQISIHSQPSPPSPDFSTPQTPNPTTFSPIYLGSPNITTSSPISFTFAYNIIYSYQQLCAVNNISNAFLDEKNIKKIEDFIEYMNCLTKFLTTVPFSQQERKYLTECITPLWYNRSKTISQIYSEISPKIEVEIENENENRKNIHQTLTTSTQAQNQLSLPLQFHSSNLPQDVRLVIKHLGSCINACSDIYQKEFQRATLAKITPPLEPQFNHIFSFQSHRIAGQARLVSYDLMKKLLTSKKDLSISTESIPDDSRQIALSIICDPKRLLGHQTEFLRFQKSLDESNQIKNLQIQITFSILKKFSTGNRVFFVFLLENGSCWTKSDGIFIEKDFSDILTHFSKLSPIAIA